MTTADQASDSLLAALSKAGIPAENHEFVRRLVMAVGIREYRAVTQSGKPYIIASRADGLPDLHIYYGYTTGFTTEDEIIRVAGAGAGRAPSSRKGTWYVKHPLNQVHTRGQRSRDVRREAAFCSCGLQLSLTGICSSCD